MTLVFNPVLGHFRAVILCCTWADDWVHMVWVRLGWVMAQFWGFWLKGGVDMVNLWLRIGTNNKTCFGPVQGD